ncbi:MAG: NAD(P) transhydrogenase subunit alpha [Bifidobacteriaceae bacterium]|jgi:NAD(P) transhydrogenase subunit alpha|nr:NAD(P) transhydrogenase subunit alpha [Bifidobacteriaceae bacterium]
MSVSLISSLSVFVLALLVGFEVISKIPNSLHTPMMSGANSIHGVILVGAMITGAMSGNIVGYILAFFAAAFGAANVVGGYVVTDRMLEMFKKRPEPAKAAGANSKEA